MKLSLGVRGNLMPAILSVTDRSLKALERDGRGAFTRRTCAVLEDEYPHFLPRFPEEEVRLAICGNMLGRAAHWGLAQQRALVAFCELMITVAGNFDEAPEIRAILDRAGSPRDRTVVALPQLASAEAWEEAEAAASDLPFFIPPSLISAPLAERTAAAISLALRGRPEATDPQNAAQAALSLAERLGIGGEEDAPLALAACTSHYGSGFPSRSQPWTLDVFRTGVSPRQAVSLLKLRLSLDFGVFV
jgi:hypothetical protein